MPYVQRDETNAIIGLYAIAQPGYAQEWLAEDSPEVVAFNNPAPSEKDYENAIQALVDQTPRERNFRDGVTLASYVASTNTLWAGQALAFIAWRDAVWAYAYAELGKVLTGQRPQPTIPELLAELPPISWPA